MPNYAIDYEYTERCSAFIPANNEEDARYMIENEEKELPGFKILNIEEVID
jgi:hypothetical protein